MLLLIEWKLGIFNLTLVKKEFAMKKIENVEMIAECAAIIPSVCVSATLGLILGNLLPAKLGPMQKIVTIIGFGAIGGYATSKTYTYATDEIKDTLNIINGLIPEDQYVKEPYASQEFHTL